MKKKVLAILMSVLLSTGSVFTASAVSGDYIMYEETEAADETQPDQAALEISAPSVILMEASTGQVMYEKSTREQRPPASVTKIMTLLLIFDALESGQIKLEDTVTTSEFAASMGGSQVFLEPGETQTVDTMIKCIAVASANDACVAMAELIAGSEQEFVSRMNERAKGLGMNDTNFMNCNGLDTEGHVTTAYDIALMSREIITKYPQIHDYSMIWMENITHTTQKGTTEFGLTNTNKLVRQYEYTTGLKTGSTSLAKFCVSATAKKNGIELIAVIMAAPDPKGRFKDATTLLNYGFGKCSRFLDETVLAKKTVRDVSGGMADEIEGVAADTFQYVDIAGADLTGIKKEIQIPDTIKAPIKKGQAIGKVVYTLNGKEIGSVDIIAKDSVGELNYLKALQKAGRTLLL